MPSQRLRLLCAPVKMIIIWICCALPAQLQVQWLAECFINIAGCKRRERYCCWRLRGVETVNNEPPDRRMSGEAQIRNLTAWEVNDYVRLLNSTSCWMLEPRLPSNDQVSATENVLSKNLFAYRAQATTGSSGTYRYQCRIDQL